MYPGLEYDFVPNSLKMCKNDYVHIQWTGSNRNPPNNDGQGVAGSDRSNLVPLTYRKFGQDISLKDHYGYFAVNFPQNLSSIGFLGLDKSNRIKLALSGSYSMNLLFFA